MATARALPWPSAVTRTGCRLLEPDAGKLARPVLRGGGGREASSLPDVRPECRPVSCDWPHCFEVWVIQPKRVAFGPVKGGLPGRRPRQKRGWVVNAVQAV
jgi:hypothetical protein